MVTYCIPPQTSLIVLRVGSPQYKLFVFSIRQQDFFYLTLPFLWIEGLRKEQSKGASWWIKLVIKMIHTGQRYLTLGITFKNSFSPALLPHSYHSHHTSIFDFTVFVCYHIEAYINIALIAVYEVDKHFTILVGFRFIWASRWRDI